MRMLQAVRQAKATFQVQGGPIGAPAPAGGLAKK